MKKTISLLLSAMLLLSALSACAFSFNTAVPARNTLAVYSVKAYSIKEKKNVELYRGGVYIPVGEAYQLSLFKDGAAETAASYNWNTSDASVFVTTDNGYVTAVGEGSAMLRLYDKQSGALALEQPVSVITGATPNRTPAFNYPLPLACYSLRKGGIGVSKTRGGTPSYYVDLTNQILVITEFFSDGTCAIRYPVDDEREYVEVYALMSDLFYDIGYGLKKGVSSGKTILYTRADCTAELGAVPSGDTTYIVAQKGSQYQVIGPVAGTGGRTAGYAMGWTKATNSADALKSAIDVATGVNSGDAQVQTVTYNGNTQNNSQTGTQNTPKTNTAKIGGTTIGDATETSSAQQTYTLETNGTLTISPLKITIKKGQKFRIKAELLNYEHPGLVYLTSNSKIATVSKTGMVKGVKAGEAVITVRTGDKGLKKKCVVTVE